MPIGTFINMLTVLVGSSVGLMLRQRLPEQIKEIIFQGIGLASLVLGMQMAFESQNFVVIIFSLLIGGIIGVAIELEARMEAWSEALKARVRVGDERFTEGLITAFLIFCIGSMTFVGALNEGLTGDRTLLLTKATLDGFTSIALASVYGVGVAFSILPMFVVQGSLTLLAGQAHSFFSPLLIDQLTAAGGVLIVGIGLSLLEIKQVRGITLLPSLIVVIFLTLLAG